MFDGVDLAVVRLVLELVGSRAQLAPGQGAGGQIKDAARGAHSLRLALRGGRVGLILVRVGGARFATCWCLRPEEL